MIERILSAETEWRGVPYVGCATTIPVGSDSYPGTVVWVSPETVDHEYVERETKRKFSVKIPKRVCIVHCEYRGIEGRNNAYTEDQRYVYFDDGNDVPTQGQIYSFRPKRKNYIAAGTSIHSSGAQSPRFGYRRYYRDPSF